MDAKKKSKKLDILSKSILILSTLCFCALIGFSAVLIPQKLSTVSADSGNYYGTWHFFDDFRIQANDLIYHNGPDGRQIYDLVPKDYSYNNHGYFSFYKPNFDYYTKSFSLTADFDIYFDGEKTSSVTNSQVRVIDYLMSSSGSWSTYIGGYKTYASSRNFCEFGSLNMSFYGAKYIPNDFDISHYSFTINNFENQPFSVDVIFDMTFFTADNKTETVHYEGVATNSNPVVYFPSNLFVNQESMEDNMIVISDCLITFINQEVGDDDFDRYFSVILNEPNTTITSDTYYLKFRDLGELYASSSSVNPIWSFVEGFLQLEVLPNIHIYTLFIITIGIAALSLVLKIFMH